jgi:hypothetical protein
MSNTKKKLFIVFDGSHPDEYEGGNLCECIGNMLQALDVDDENLPFVIEDIQTFLSEELDEDGRLKRRFSTGMFCTAEWCYGYDSWEEAFEEGDDDGRS